MQTECGYTPAEARDVTLPEWLDLAAYWRRYPPHGRMLEILARLWGWKPPEAELQPMSYAAACALDGDMFRGMGRWFPKASSKT